MERYIAKDSRKNLSGFESILKPFIRTFKRAVSGIWQDIDAKKPKLRATIGESGIDIYSKNAAKDIKTETVNLISRFANKKNCDGIAVLCIGAELAMCGADNLGPMVGSMLNKNHKSKGVYVYGTMEHPIDGSNIEEKTPQILQKHENSFIIGIDCCATFKKEEYRRIFIEKRKLRPGSALGKKRPAFGDIIVTAALVHREIGDNEYDILRKVVNTDAQIVRIAAEVISTGLHKALKEVAEKGIVLLDRKGEQGKQICF